MACQQTTDDDGAELDLPVASSRRLIKYNALEMLVAGFNGLTAEELLECRRRRHEAVLCDAIKVATIQARDKIERAWPLSRGRLTTSDLDLVERETLRALRANALAAGSG